METPLDIMILRTAHLDALVTVPGVKERLKTTSSPIGGSYGDVRSGGKKKHKGWDLYARIGTSCYSITPGEIVFTGPINGYGTSIVLKLNGAEATALAKKHSVKAIYALYAHLSAALVGKMSILEGARIALSGNDGNASDSPPHLHFELRTSELPRKGVDDTIDPTELFGNQFSVCRPDDEDIIKAMFS